MTGSDHFRASARSRLDMSDALAALAAAQCDGDAGRRRAAEDAVVIAHLRIAAMIARRHRDRGVDSDDLDQVARIGLIKAARRWRPDIGPFLAYAKPTIEGEIRRYLRDSRSPIRIPRGLQEARPQVLTAASDLRQECCREPTPAEIAARLGLTVETVRAVQQVDSAIRLLSTDEYGTLTDVPSWQAERDLGDAVMRADLRAAVAGLPEQHRHVIALRFVWGQSQAQIAAALDVSQMQISRILRAATTQLRQRLQVIARAS